jgi:hypothetical protein
MERFLIRHKDRIAGIISGFDRILFRGTLVTISHPGGMDRFLSSRRVLYKNFKEFVEKISGVIKKNAEELAQREGRPFEYLASSKESKEERATKIMERDQIKEGLICVFSSVEPCRSFNIRKDRNSKHLKLTTEERKCLHLYFYYMDREFGLMHVRLQTWLPLTIQVCVNGREWLARQMDERGIEYRQVDNCFTWISDSEGAQELSDQLDELKWVGMLEAMAQRVNPWLNPEGELVLKPYYWTMRQSEYATDILFKDDQSLEEVYPDLIHFAIEEFTTEDILRFLSGPKRSRCKGEVRSSLQRRGEGIRVRHWVKENSVKMYNKAGSVLRVETTINYPRRFKFRRHKLTEDGYQFQWLPMRKGVADIARRVEISRAANERYFQALAVVGDKTPSRKIMDSVSKRVQTSFGNFRALRPISPEDAALFSAILNGANYLQGVRNSDLRALLHPDVARDREKRRKAAAKITRQLRLLRGHRLIYRVQHTHYYRVTTKGQQVMSTAIRFRETDIALLAA